MSSFKVRSNGRQQEITPNGIQEGQQILFVILTRTAPNILARTAESRDVKGTIGPTSHTLEHQTVSANTV